MRYKINMNQMVKVRLSKEALERIQGEYNEFNKKFNEDLKLPIDSEGYYKSQLWCIMKDFGDMICGCYSPIADCNILFDEVEITDEV
ncbi:hypothetical protein [Clostridium perfringens]|uniref:hypothetical protein n=1 Tax=Clostridium perfringens TaxID=1502 RepID=UPI00096A57EC|nr:hypothetical protein [Clostridium perfringens]